MTGRRTNLALAALSGLAVASGAAAFGAGAGSSRWVTGIHGAIGMSLVLLTPSKVRIARQGMGRHQGDRATSVTLSVLVVLALVTGLAHSSGIGGEVGGLRALHVHVAASLVALPLLVWHMRARPARPRRADLSRRSVLESAGLLGASALAYGVLEGALRLGRLPGARRRGTGSYEAGSFAPPEMPVTQWLNDEVSLVDPSGWQLSVTAGGQQRTWSLGELDLGDQVTAVLDCTGGWYASQVWEGARLDRLLAPVGAARSIVVRSLSGYVRRFPVADLQHLLLATRVGGKPLSPGHGFPARLVAPARRGFWWVKWVKSIELDSRPWWLQSPFPLD
ncbi:MAG: molybdopterin-dependent oxidoreductase [Acidimicrobiia bacterium]